MNNEVVGGPPEVLLLAGDLERARAFMKALRSSPVRTRLMWVRDAQDARDLLFQHGRYAHAPLPDLILLDEPLREQGDDSLVEELENEAQARHIPCVRLVEDEDADHAAALNRGPHGASLVRIIRVVRGIARLAC